MSINLASIVRPRSKTRRSLKKTKKIRAVKPSRQNELWYKTQLLSIVKRLRSITESSIKAEVKLNVGQANQANDEIPSWIDKALRAAAKEFGGLERQAALLSDLAAKRNLSHLDKGLSESIKSAFGVDLSSVLSVDAIREPFKNAVASNVSLITSIAPEYFSKIEQAVSKNWTDGMRSESLIDSIMHIGDVTESRAKLIARDQTSKMNSAFNRARQESLGVAKYVWQTAGDERVRDEHADYDGQEFSWDDPPSDGHPGEAVACRCTALPVIEIDSESDGFGEFAESVITGYSVGSALAGLGNL